MKSLAPNTLIQNRYLIVQLIGKGGMGEVYLAVDQRLGSAIALKRMLFSDEAALGQAFEREAKTLARLRHPALTKVSDHFTENEMQYLVMEHISGDDLSKRLEANQKPFPLSWVLFWADQLLDALNYLHSHEPPIIHRDIKPQNLKLTDDNHIILLDFGLAKDSVGETRLSTTGNVIAYTPNYASMEQIRGTGTTARSDIYALSATMYQLLTNTPPADSLTRADNVLNSLPDPVTPLSDVNSEVSESISGIIMKGMSLSSEQRFANAKEMQMALREAYSQVQQGMSADTVSFNAPENVPATVLQSDVKTEQFSVPNISQPVGEKTEVMPVTLVKETSEYKALEINETPVDLNATIPYATAFTDEKDISPIGAKTEVMSPEISQSFGDKTEISPIDFSIPVGEKTEVIQIEDPLPLVENTAYFPVDEISQHQAEPFQSVDSYKPEESYQSEDTYKPEESYSPEMTIPIVNYGEEISELPKQETSNFVAFPPEEIKETPVVMENKPEPKKKAAAGGGSKMFLILGVLAVLAFLGIGVAGAGLYVFMPELFISATPTPTSTPIETPTEVPIVSPSEEPTLAADNNTNTGNSSVDLTNTNTNSEAENTNVNAETPDAKTPRPTVEKTQQPTKQPTVQPTRQPTKQPTQQPTKPPAPKTPVPAKTIDRSRPIP